MIIYISGAITGTPDYMERFAEAERRLVADGNEVINPAKICSLLPSSTTWEQYMELDYLLLDMADEVYMLKGWEESKGARLEHEHAYVWGMTITYQEQCEGEQMKAITNGGLKKRLEIETKARKLQEIEDAIGFELYSCQRELILDNAIRCRNVRCSGQTTAHCIRLLLQTDQEPIRLWDRLQIERLADNPGYGSNYYRFFRDFLFENYSALVRAGIDVRKVELEEPRGYRDKDSQGNH